MLKSFYPVPEKKKFRVIVNSDAKNEADDQFAIAHALLTPKLIVKGVIAAHFGTHTEQSMEKSYDEVVHVLNLMGLTDEIAALKGAAHALPDEKTPVPSEGADLIIREAMADESQRLFAIFFGPLTDLASAYLLQPEIAGRVTAIWSGGGNYPNGNWEYNLFNDIHAANVVFQSGIELWQVPQQVYSIMRVSLAELCLKVAPCGEIGQYLFQQMVDFNLSKQDIADWPHGESWSLGDSPAIGLLLDDHHHSHDFDLIPAPRITPTMDYVDCASDRMLRVYKSLDHRFVLEDMFAKLTLQYGRI